MKPPHPTQARRAIEVLRDILHRERPADALLADCFRHHREMGGRDRRHVSDLVYGVLRDWRRLEHWVGTTPEALIAAVLSQHPAMTGDDLARYDLSPPPPPPQGLPWPVLDNLPDTLASDLQALLPETEWRSAAQALNEPGPADFRINPLRGSRDHLMAALRRRGIEVHPTPWAPDGLRLSRRLPHTDPLLADGSLEPQDEGSQWLVACLPLRAGDTVLDYCAGAGGKSLAMTARGAQVVATDADPHRLRRLPSRARRAGVAITLASFPPDTDHRFDGVLVDAPCSGSGTLRRAPERRLDTPDLGALSALQLQVLRDAARHVTPGGWLVYATCSLSPRENETVVQAFEDEHPDFHPTPLQRPEGGGAPRLRLWPHRHGTDGFFAAGFRRTP